ncbi:MAG TPA: hypothetical protein VGJ07_28660 [Rugosimonospora sp.]
MPVDTKVRKAIDTIPADAWTGIEYQPVWDDEQQRFISRTQVEKPRQQRDGKELAGDLG